MKIGTSIKIAKTASPALGLMGLMFMTVILTACGGYRHKINLMPAPAVFADGEINPLPAGEPPVSYYVHGFRVVFDIPVLVAAELWHFLGYRGAFVAYTWPATPHFLAYGADVETAIHMARKLRLFLTYLAGDDGRR